MRRLLRVALACVLLPLAASRASAATLPSATWLTQLSTPAVQWQLLAVRAKEVWPITQGEGVVVAVLDTGVDGTHPEFAGRITTGYDAIADRLIPADRNSDDVGHGTHVAGIIAAADDGRGVTGIAPRATIMPVKVLGRSGGDDDVVARGIYWATDRGASIINLSLGVASNNQASSTGAICDAVAYASSRNALVFAAAGNEGGRLSNPRNIPASCPGSISVAALGEDLAPTSFSSFDATVVLSAPGSRIYSTVPRTPEAEFGAISGFADMRGTSMASPVAAGVAALARAAFPRETREQSIRRLISGAQDLGARGRDPFTGFGLVDALASVAPETPRLTLAEVKRGIAATVAPSVEASFNSGDLVVSHTGLRDVDVVSYDVDVLDVTNNIAISRTLSPFDVRTIFQGLNDGYYLVRVSSRTVVGNVEGNWNMVETPAWLTSGASLEGLAQEKTTSFEPSEPILLNGVWTQNGFVVRAKFNRDTEFAIDVQFGETDVQSVSSFTRKVQDEVLFPVKRDDYLRRSSPVRVWLAYGAYGDVIERAFPAELPISLSASRAGSSTWLIRGSVSSVCAKNCAGSVSLRDPKGNWRAVVPVARDGFFALSASGARLPTSVEAAYRSTKSPPVPLRR